MKKSDERKYLSIISHYEACLDEHGDTHRGVDWPNKRDAEARYRVMLEVIRPEHAAPVRLLDFGCGTSHLYEFILRNNISNVEYSGLDISARFVAVSKRKFPDVDFYHVDILQDPGRLPTFDYVVMNGVFTEKRNLTYDEMLAYMEALLPLVFEKAAVGIAFNLMSKEVDWERDDLFHVPIDTVAALLTRKLSRHFRIRHDYGLYEYTVFVYKLPFADRSHS